MFYILYKLRCAGWWSAEQASLRVTTALMGVIREPETGLQSLSHKQRTHIFTFTHVELWWISEFGIHGSWVICSIIEEGFESLYHHNCNKLTNCRSLQGDISSGPGARILCKRRFNSSQFYFQRCRTQTHSSWWMWFITRLITKGSLFVARSVVRKTSNGEGEILTLVVPPKKCPFR